VNLKRESIATVHYTAMKSVLFIRSGALFLCAAATSIVLLSSCGKSEVQHQTKTTMLTVAEAANGTQQDAAKRSVNYSLIAQDGSSFYFPSDARGKVAVVGFIYTNCSGVCQTITATMKRVERQMLDRAEQRREGQLPSTMFALITFDPSRDKPSVLREFAALHGVDAVDFSAGRWKALTGNTHVLEALMRSYGVETRFSFPQKNAQGKTTYFIDHTDLIVLLDQSGAVVKQYEGSSVEPEKIIKDIEALGVAPAFASSGTRSKKNVRNSN